MFAALTIVRLREAVTEANLSTKTSWLSPDDVDALDLPLAQAVEKVLASMHTVLEKTKFARDEALKGMEALLEMEGESEKRVHLRKTKAAEVRLVRNLKDLREPRIIFKAKRFEAEDEKG